MSAPAAGEPLAPTLVFGWGNPSRGDDALGPLFVERIQTLAAQHPEWGAVECLTDFQLQVEHALDLQGRARVLFVDASVEAEAPFTLEAIGAAHDATFSTHAMSPRAVLQVLCEVTDEDPPPTWLLAIRGESFELGDGLSPAAAAHFDAALVWVTVWMAGASEPGIVDLSPVT
ncbi:MAG: hydrogenase maturation protease [Betaproteobacteria bacterium]|nr:hydrogenase maturation protease [Betaproteobacteria bacterium]